MLVPLIVKLIVNLIVLLFFAASLVLRLARQDRRRLTGLLLFPFATGLLIAGIGIGAGIEGGSWFGTLGGLLAGTLLLVTGLAEAESLPNDSSSPVDGRPSQKQPPRYLAGLVLIGVLLGLIGFACVALSNLAERWLAPAAFLPFFFGTGFIFLAISIERPAFGLLLILLIGVAAAYAAAISGDIAPLPTHHVGANE